MPSGFYYKGKHNCKHEIDALMQHLFGDDWHEKTVEQLLAVKPHADPKALQFALDHYHAMQALDSLANETEV